MSFALTIATLITPLALGVPPAPTPAGPAAPTPAPLSLSAGAAVESLPAGDGAAATDIERYGELERKAPAKVAEFRGGSTEIYISGGVILVLLIVLLIVLL